MNSFTLALRSLARRRSRTLFLVLIVTMASASVIVLSTLIARMQSSMERTFDSFGANVLITPRTNTLTLQYGAITLGGIDSAEQSIREQDLERIGTIPDRGSIRVFSPKLLGTRTIKGVDALLMGVRFVDEVELQRHWSLESGRYPEGDDELLIGALAAETLGIEVGDRMDLFDGGFTAVGVLAPTGGAEDRVVYADLETVQAGLDMPGKVSFVELSAFCSECPLSEMVRQLTEALPGLRVVGLSAVHKKRMEAVDSLARYAGLIILALSGLTLLVVALLFGSAVQERAREIGVLKAVGFPSRTVGRMFVLEAMLVCGIGSVLGALGGGAATVFLDAGEFGPAAPAVNYPIILAVVLIFTVIGMLACIPPSRAAAGLDPARTLRSV